MPKRWKFNRLWPTVLILIGLTVGCQIKAPQARVGSLRAAEAPSVMSFTVSMEEPASNRFRVIFQYEGVREKFVELKMPAWSPGYYRILNFARNVDGFKAKDESSHLLNWEKIADDTWKIKMDGVRTLRVSYEVAASGKGVAESQLNEKGAYISPTSVFMFVAGKLDHHIRVSVKPHQGFSRISTALEPVIGEENTFYADNFDELYDCPIYVGNHEVLTFTVGQVPYELAMQEPGDFNKDEIISALKRMIVSATGIVGEIPYKRYVFMMMGEGMGGLEHRNSMAVFTRIPRPGDHKDYQRWLSFITHEFFHLYNIKAIRPIALGPFDYERENRTSMLWFSEGGTVYYEYIIMKRAGFMSRDEVLSTFSRIIDKVEHSPGRKLQSAALASYNTWTEPFFGSEKTISYYDIGAILTMLLDLKIRHETDNNKTLDDVMRVLYQRFYKERRRGFTDEEFRGVCEEVEGTDLSEFFNYVYTSEPIDYDKYLGYAGLKLEIKEREGNRRSYTIKLQEEFDGRQLRLLNSWL